MMGAGAERVRSLRKGLAFSRLGAKVADLLDAVWAGIYHLPSSLGDSDGGPFIVETLATMIRNELGKSSLEVVRNEIARGVAGEPIEKTMLVSDADAGADTPVGQA